MTFGHLILFCLLGNEARYMNLENRLKLIRETPLLSEDHVGYVDFFLSKAFGREGSVLCPCKICQNRERTCVQDEIRLHLIRDGFDRNYDVWTFHGEVRCRDRVGSSGKSSDHSKMDAMFENVMRDFDGEPEILASFLGEKNRKLYPGCREEDTVISCLMEIFNMKGANGWSDSSVNSMLKFLQKKLPEGNLLPDNLYEAKKILCPMGLEYEKIHACPNDCILYRGVDYENLDNCPVCQASRYKKILRKQHKGGGENLSMKKKRVPIKCLWYLPIIPRFERLFGNAEDAKNLTWHVDRDKGGENVISHPADGDQWKKFDKRYSTFGEGDRNLRLALCTDGMNPFGTLSSKHSSWPVMLVMYNLPPYLCMKRKYVLMPLMISGPKQPGNDIDVYLQPLIDDLVKLWHHGVLVYDAHRKETFNLKAMLHWTINDFPALGNLAGYSVKGHKACPVCEEKTESKQLKHGRKTVYLGYRKFLKRNHKFRLDKDNFFGGKDVREAPIPITGRKIHLKVSKLNVVFGKKVRKNSKDATSPWKKRSIFFNLPYWEHLDVRHCLDVMHIEKNVCESLFGTLLGIPSKTKDNYNARKDLVEMGIRPELAPEQKGKRVYLPPSACNLSREERKSVCDSLEGMKVPIGYSSNISRAVTSDKKLSTLKSHDCHVLMQQLLPVALRGVLDEDVRYCITRLCFFFHSICRKSIDRVELDVLENEAAEVLSLLEAYFPPSFFDIMVHLVVHLVRQIRICGPVFLHWMYPFERYMGIFKKYGKNPYRPDASIVERYVTEEIIEHCTSYLQEGVGFGVPKNRHEGRKEGAPRNKGQLQRPLYADMKVLHHYILRNSKETVAYVQEHLDLLNELHSDLETIEAAHKENFVDWFYCRCYKKGMDEQLRAFASKPDCTVRSYSGYDINGYSFTTFSKDEKSTTQSSGVYVDGETVLNVKGKKDKRHVVGVLPFYGHIEEIWEVDYIAFKVVVFKCKWVDPIEGVDLKDPMGFTRVRKDREGYKHDPFILASQARQVFYVDDPVDRKWSIALQGKKYFFEDEIDYKNTGEMAEFPSVFPELPKRGGDIAYRRQHDDGLWVDEDGTFIVEQGAKLSSSGRN